MLCTDQTRQPFQILVIDSSILKYIGCHDYLPRAHIQKLLCIVCVDAATNLQALWICSKCKLRLFQICLIVCTASRIQQDNMSADQTASAIQISIEICLQLRNEVILGKISLILQAAADNLLDCAIMYVNAWSKPHNTLLLRLSV